MSHAVAIISGATRGLGLALAIELRAHGFAVAGCGTSRRRRRPCGRSLRRPASAAAARSLLRAVDVADAAAVRGVGRRDPRELGAPDLVIANAGVVNAPRRSGSSRPTSLRRALAVNAGGVANLLRAFLPAMIARGTGTFVAISSGWGRRGKEGLSPYCASKFAVEGLVQSVALEVPAPLRVVSLDPGNGVRTAMLDTCLPDELDVAYPSPADWAAQAVEFLLGEVLRPERQHAEGAAARSCDELRGRPHRRHRRRPRLRPRARAVLRRPRRRAAARRAQPRRGAAHVRRDRRARQRSRPRLRLRPRRPRLDRRLRERRRRAHGPRRRARQQRRALARGRRPARRPPTTRSPTRSPPARPAAS